VGARVGAAVRVRAAAKAPSWAPWHSSVEVAEVVRGVGNVGKSERQQRLLRGVPAVAIRRKAMYIVRGSVHECPPGPMHRDRRESGCRFCHKFVTGATHFGKLEISRREDVQRGRSKIHR
jgi:hypothetical protein